MPDQAGQCFGIKAEIQNRIHHAGHRQGRARTDRQQQHVFRITKSLAGQCLQFVYLVVDFIHQAGWQLAVLGIQVAEAGLGTDHETRGYINADLRHFAQVGALAAEQLFVLAVALLE